MKESYNEFLRDNDVEIVSTALSKDFEEHGNSEQFIFIVTFKRKSKMSNEKERHKLKIKISKKLKKLVFDILNESMGIAIKSLNFVLKLVLNGTKSPLIKRLKQL